jgi:hypothetical protein
MDMTTLEFKLPEDEVRLEDVVGGVPHRVTV